MKRHILLPLLALPLLLVSDALCQKQTFSVDPKASEVAFSLSGSDHSVHGTFQVQNGSIDFDPGAMKISGSVVVAAGTGKSGNDSRDHKMSTDALDAPHFAEVSFVPQSYQSTIASSGDSTIQVTGALALHGTPHELIVPIQMDPSPSSQPPAEARTIALTVPEGTPLQIALDSEVRVRKVGQPIHGRVMQPVYVFDYLVIPTGTQATGHIVAIAAVPGRTRALSALNADFTPARKLSVNFDQLILPGGRATELHATVVPGSGQVIQLATAGEHQKKNAVKDAAARKMEQARAQWHDARKQIESPDRMHVFVRYAVAQLPAHPQYIDAGTVYSAELSQPLDFGSESVFAASLSSIGTQPPPGSLVHAMLLTPLDSKHTQKGSDVDAALSQPLFDKGRLILPAGTRLRGSVLQVRAARSLHRNGQLRIAFRQIILPDGAVQTVDTSLQGVESDAAGNVQLDTEGGAKSTPSKTRYITTGVSVGLALIGSGGKNDVGTAGPVAGGATGYKLIGIIVGAAYQNHTYAILMSAYGGGSSIYRNFLARGREIVFPKNTAIDIGFGNRTTLPMPTADRGPAR